MDYLDKQEIISSSKVYNDIELRNKLLDTYLKPIKTISEISGIFLGIPLILTIILPNSNDIESIFTIWGFFVFVWLIAIIFILSQRSIAKKIKKDNSPLLCYEGKIEKIYNTSRRVRQLNGNRYIEQYYYIEFENNRKFEISRKEYKECLKNNVKSVKIYFFEELLIDKNKYHLKPIMVECSSNFAEDYSNNTCNNTINNTAAKTEYLKNQIIKNSQISEDYSKKETILKKYIKNKNSKLSVVITCLIMVLFISYVLFVCYSSTRTTNELPIIFIIAFLLTATPFIIIGMPKFISYNKLRLIVKQIKKPDEPLMYLDSKIVDKYKKEKNYTNRNGWYIQAYILLENDIELEISENLYNKIQSEKLKCIKLTYFKNTIKDSKHISLTENNEIFVLDFYR